MAIRNFEAPGDRVSTLKRSSAAELCFTIESVLKSCMCLLRSITIIV